MLPSYLDSMNPEPSLERPRACPTSFTGTAPRTQATTALPTVKARLRLRRRIVDFFLWHKLYLFYWETEQREERHQTWGVNLLSVRVKRLVRGFYPFPKGKP